MLIAICSAIIFGIYPAASRAAYTDGANITFVLFLTTFVRTFMLTGFCLSTGKKLYQKKNENKVALLGGFWQALSVIGIIGGCYFIPGPLVLIILFTHTLMLLFFMGWRGEVTLDAITILTTVLALVGLTLVLNIWDEQTADSWIGIALAFMAAVATACRIYIFGSQMKDRNPAAVGAEIFIITSVLILPVALWQMPIVPETISGWLYGGLASLSLGLGSFGMFYGIALLGSFRFSLFLKIEPIFTALFSVWLLDEYLKTSQYLGMGVVIVSLVSYQVLSHRKQKRIAALKAAAENGL